MRKRYDAPSLPPYPALMFDDQTKEAVIVARHPTWKGHVWSNEILGLAALAAWWLIALSLLDYLEAFSPIVRFFGALWGTVMIFPIAQSIVRPIIHGLLVRRVFVTTTKIWFTPNEIAFRSRLYDQGVVFPRTFNGTPVNFEFVVSSDSEAHHYASKLGRKKKFLGKDEVNLASLIEMIISIDAGPLQAGKQLPQSVRRPIPIASFLHDWPQRFTMVCNAAMALTSENALHQRTTQSQPSPTAGHDIDFASN